MHKPLLHEQAGLWLTHNLDADLTSAFALFWFHSQEKEIFVSILISSRSPADLQYRFKHVTDSQMLHSPLGLRYV